VIQLEEKNWIWKTEEYWLVQVSTLKMKWLLCYPKHMYLKNGQNFETYKHENDDFMIEFKNKGRMI
jgi:hypothetical protein